MVKAMSEAEKEEKRNQKKIKKFANDTEVLDIDEELDKKYQQKCILLQESISSEKFQFYISNEEMRKESISYFEYGTNGDLHRGYYCPSPIIDIVIGNCKRGRRIKQRREEKEYNYEYGFDKDGRLVRVRGWWRKEKKWGEEEMLVYNGDTCLSYFPDLMGTREYMSETVFNNGKLTSYKTLRISFEKHKVYHEERYEYNEYGLKKVFWIDYSSGDRPHHLSERLYHFRHDDKGYLSTYYMEHLYKNPLKQGIWDNFHFPELSEPQWHKVYLKRKI